MPGYEPHNLWGIVGYLVVGLFFVAVAWISHRKQNQKLGSIEDQVTNGGRNLRDDIDRIILAVDGTREDVAELRGELRGLTHRVDQFGP